MPDHAHAMDLPRAPLLAAAALIVVSLAAVAFVRITGVGSLRVADAPTVTRHDLRFEDRPDGSIVVVDTASHLTVATVRGAQGFLRGTLRGLARERRRLGIGADAPFSLSAHADGRLTLEDPATRLRVDLDSFGPTNTRVFAQLLETAEAADTTHTADMAHTTHTTYTVRTAAARTR